MRVHGFEFPASLEGIAEVVGLAEKFRALLNTRAAGPALPHVFLNANHLGHHRHSHAT